MRPALLILPLLSTQLAAFAEDEEPIRIEVKAASAQQQRRQDNLGRVLVGREELSRYGDASVADVLRRQPGISIVEGAVQLRGLGGGRTQVLLNGEPAPPGFSPDSLAPALIERIEILRSASADASTQAIAGSINIVLRKPAARAQSLATLAAARGASAWSPEAALDLAWPGAAVSSALAANAARTQRGFDSSVLEQSPGNLRSTAETGRALTERISLTPRLNWKFDDGASLAWQSLLDVARSDNHGQALETQLQGQASAYPRNGFEAASDTTTVRSDANWSQGLGDNGRFDAKAGVAHNRRASDYRFTGRDASGTPQWQRHVLSSAADDSTSTSGKWRQAGDSGHALALGWDGALITRSERRLQNDADANGTPLAQLDQRYTARVRRLALYAQDEWSPTPALDLYAGLRWELLRTRTDGRDLAAVTSDAGAWSPVAHLLWRLPGSRDQLRWALARTYKAPATRDLVPRRYTVNNTNSPTNPHVQGNPALRPELAWGIDLAYETYFSGDSMFSVSAYERRIADVILPFLFQDKGDWVSTPRNAGQASVRGLEFDLRAALGQSGVTGRASWSRNWSQVAAVPGPSNRLDEQTPQVLNAGLDYRHSAALSMGLNWNRQTGGLTRSSLTQWRARGTVDRLDVNGRWQLQQGLAMRLTAANLLAPSEHTDLRYEDSSGATTRSTTTRGERMLKLAIEIRL